MDEGGRWVKTGRRKKGRRTNEATGARRRVTSILRKKRRKGNILGGRRTEWELGAKSVPTGHDSQNLKSMNWEGKAAVGEGKTLARSIRKSDIRGCPEVVHRHAGKW